MTGPQLSSAQTQIDSANSSAPLTGSPPWRAPSNAPAWAQGKTPEEILGITVQAVNALEQLATQQRQTPQPQPQPQPSSDPWGVRDDDYITGETFKRLMSQAVTGVQQNFQNTYANQAQINLDRVKTQHPKVFEKYGPEVLGMVNYLPLEQRSFDNLTQIVNIVRGNHVDDLAAELARGMVQADPTLRGTSGSAPLNGQSPGYLGDLTQSPELSQEYRDMLKSKGIDERALMEFCQKNGITTQQWFEDAKKHRMNVITERSEIRGGTQTQTTR